MESQTRKRAAQFETTRRLLAALVNEGLCSATIKNESSSAQNWLCLRPRELSRDVTKIYKVKVGLSSAQLIKSTGDIVASLIRPDQLFAPVLVQTGNYFDTAREERDPGIIFQNIAHWVGDVCDLKTISSIKGKLQNSAENQEKWLEIGEGMPELDIMAPAIAWEKTLIWGHPSHPYHRTCSPQGPLSWEAPYSVSQMLTPEILFLSVPRSQIHITGPFESTLRELFIKLGIPNPTPDRILVPAIAQQRPAIKSRFPNVYVVGTEQAFAQASTRTITLRSELRFKYCLKLSLACEITSAMRTITPWSAMGGPAVSELLVELVPPNLWIYREIASVTGAQADFNEARHFSCILREDVEFRAREQGETLIVAAALAQRTVGRSVTYAERLFALDSLESKLSWLRSYATILLKLTLTPLLKHGIALEAHGQNITVRICKKTLEIKGFAYRDLGGFRMHMPTLHSQGYRLDTMPTGSAITSYDLSEVWNKMHHAVFQNHLGPLISALKLHDQGGWAIVREVVREVLSSEEGEELLRFILKETMAFKCFLRMSMAGKYRDYVVRDIPNVVLT